MNFKSADEHEKWLQEPRSRLKTIKLLFYTQIIPILSPFFPYHQGYIPNLQNLLEFLDHLQHNQQNYQKWIRFKKLVSFIQKILDWSMIMRYYLLLIHSMAHNLPYLEPNLFTMCACYSFGEPFLTPSESEYSFVHSSYSTERTTHTKSWFGIDGWLLCGIEVSHAKPAHYVWCDWF